MISFEEFEQQWLEEIVAGSPSNTQLGHRFAEIWRLARDRFCNSGGHLV